MVNVFCLVFGLALISFGLYLKKKSMEKNPSNKLNAYMAWTMVDTFFWLTFSGATVLGAFALFALLIGNL
jgi:hypothetical protein